MKAKVVWALAALNVLLLAWLVWPNAGTPEAHAQAPRPGEYMMLPGEVVGGSGAIIYMIDETNRKLSARAFDQNARQMSDMAPIDLDRVFDPRAAAPPPR